MRFAAALLGLLLASTAVAQEQEPPAEEEAAAQDDRAGWSAKQWMSAFYERKAAGDTTVLRELLDGALAAPGSTPALTQQMSGESGYLAKAEGDLATAGRAFADTAKGPDEATATNAAAELSITRDQILQKGREARAVRNLEEAEEWFALAEELGADAEVLATERGLLADTGNAVDEELAAWQDPTVVSWGKPPHPTEALKDPVPPDLPEEDWLADYSAARSEGLDVEDLEEMLDELDDEEEDAWAQRLQIERGYLGIDAGDQLAAGRSFLKALEGPDEGLSTRAEAELRRLQRHFRSLAVQYTHLGDLGRADTAYRTAEALGADAQFMAYERSYLAGLDGDEDKVVELLTLASQGPNVPVREQAEYELAARSGFASGTNLEASKHITAHLEHRDAGRYDEANAELDQALEDDADLQLIELYRAYVDKLAGEDFAARKHFQNVRDGEDEDMAKRAKQELRYTAKPVWADLYGEGFGWARVLPEDEQFDDFAGLLRVRGYLHPFPKVGFDPYIFAQVSGDVKSRNAVGGDVGPLIYADNSVLLGGGLLLRWWKNRMSAWGQVAAAFPWVKPATAQDVQLDIQVGAAIMFATEGCSPAHGKPAYFTTLLCAEFYGDTVYRNRPIHNVYFSARGRVGMTWLVTGPVAWAPMFETRFGKDVMDNPWAGLIDVGLLHRWRLMGPIGIDLNLGVHTGTNLPVPGAVPATPPPPYVDFRLLLSGYVSF